MQIVPLWYQFGVSGATKGAILDHLDAEKPKRGNGLAHTPARARMRERLDTLPRIRREMTRLYIDGRDGRRDVGDVSKLANVLGLIGRAIEGGEIEARLEALESARG